jgi:hypothetical protein
MADDYDQTINELKESYGFINEMANKSLGQPPKKDVKKTEVKKEESNKFNRKQMVDDFVKEEGREPTLQELETLKQQGLWE